MSDSRPCSLDVSPGTGPLAHRFPGFLWAAAVVWLVAINAGCTSSLTAIALRDAMREIAEYGRRGEKAVEEADDRQLAVRRGRRPLRGAVEGVDAGSSGFEIKQAAAHLR